MGLRSQFGCREKRRVSGKALKCLTRPVPAMNVNRHLAWPLVLGLERSWINRRDHCVRFPERCSDQGSRRRCNIVCGSRAGTEGFALRVPSRLGDGHFVGVVRVLDRVCAKASLKGVTPHVLRHTFASVAGILDFLNSQLPVCSATQHAG
jgi:integrase